jgi:putative ABC transport system substrate-binding protein
MSFGRRHVLRMCLAPLGLAAAGRTRSALGQAARPARVGWLQIQAEGAMLTWLRAFRSSLALLGQQEGRSWALEARYADGDAGKLSGLAQALVDTGVAVIVATSQPAVDAARRATRTIPIVGRMTDDPVAAGAVESLARPGGNLTGDYSLLEALSAKRLALLRQAAPSIRRVGALLTLERGATRHWLDVTRSAAEPLGVTIDPIDVHGPDELDRAFAQAAARGVDSILAFRNPTVVTYARRVIALANQHRMPSAFDAREFAEAGGLLAYGPNLELIFGRLAGYVDKILKGEPVGTLAIEQPASFELVVNARTARALELTLPPSLLASADDVID